MDPKKLSTVSYRVGLLGGLSEWMYKGRSGEPSPREETTGLRLRERQELARQRGNGDGLPEQEQTDRAQRRGQFVWCEYF